MSRQAIASEDSVLIWLLDEDDLQSPIHEVILKTVIDNVRLFWNIEEFLACVSALSGYCLFVILGKKRTSLVRKLLLFDYIVCIYLQGMNNGDKLVDTENKIRGENLDESELFLRLSQDATVCKRTPMHLAFCAPSNERSAHTAPQDEIHFLWSQTILQIILQFPRPTTSIAQTYKDVIEESRLCYHDDVLMLGRIDNFAQTYKPDEVITWYTQVSFLYRVLNRALRTENMVVIYKFRFILQDIYFQLGRLFQAQQSTLIHGRVQSDIIVLINL
jgi:hypothetical protein